MNKDPAFLFYSADFLIGTSFMSDEEKGKYIKALCVLHQNGGRLPKAKLECVVGTMTEAVLEKFLTDKQGYLFNKKLKDVCDKRASFCESRRQNINKRYNKSTHVSQDVLHVENENVNKNVNKDIKKKNTIAIPPLRADVVSYCLERKNNIGADAFMNHYDSVGWIIGKKKMVNWKAAIRTWEQRNKDNPQFNKNVQPPGRSPRNTFASPGKPDPKEQEKVAELMRETAKGMK